MTLYYILYREDFCEVSQYYKFVSVGSKMLYKHSKFWLFIHLDVLIMSTLGYIGKTSSIDRTYMLSLYTFVFNIFTINFIFYAIWLIWIKLFLTWGKHSLTFEEENIYMNFLGILGN